MQEPHQKPAVTGETVVQKAPPARPDFEWDGQQDEDDAAATGSAEAAPPASASDAGSGESPPGVGDVRRGSGAPDAVPPQPTVPRSVSPAALRTLQRLSGGATGPAARSKDPAVKATPTTAAAQTEPPQEEAGVDPAASTPAVEVVAKASGDATQSAAAASTPAANPALGAQDDGWADLTEEVAEIQFLQLQGFDDEAREAVTPLVAEHPGHPDLAPICSALGIAFEARPPEDLSGSSDTKESTETVASAPIEPALDPAGTADVPAAEIPGDGDARADGEAGPPATAFAAPAPPDPPALAGSSAPQTAQPADASLGGGEPLGDVTDPALSQRADALAADGSRDAEEESDEGEDDEDDEFIEINIDITAPRMKAPPELVASSEAGLLPEAADRTVITAGLQAPRPFATEESAAPLEPKAPELATPGAESPESPTLVRGTEPPPGGFVERQPGVPRTLAPRLTPKLGLGSGASTPPRSTDSMITNPRLPAASPSEGANEDPVTVVSAPPAEPRPVAIENDVPPRDSVRLVMLGSRGQAVAERVVAVGEALVLSRDPTEPWGDDKHLQEEHARLQPAPNGGVTVEGWGTGRVFRQVDERLRVRDGDLIRVGQSLVRYTATPGGWGTLTGYPLSAEPSRTVTVGGSGAVVGRDSGELEIPDDTYISGAHCQFSCRGDDLFIEDLGSANGTYVLVRSGESVPFGGLLLAGQTQFKVRRVKKR